MTDHDETVERIAAPLRAPVSLGDDFDARVMRQVRSLARERAPWWRRGYTLRVTPIGGLALAAGLALGAVLARRALLPREQGAPAVVAAAHRDTVYLVRFTFVHPAARSVALVGDFNGWSAGATPLAGGTKRGVWSVSVPMTRGRHEYAFIVDGARWVSDPLAATVDDEFGTSSSVVRVGAES